mgnify:CR=1 FL=1
MLPNRIYPGDKITLRIYLRAIQQDTLLGGLLREMSKASLDVIAGAVGAATATGPMAVLLAAGASLTSGVREILNQGRRGLTILDPEGLEITLSAADLRGPETYLLIHRGMNLAASQFRLAGNGNNITDVLYACLLYTSDAADELLCVALGGRRIIQKKKQYTTISH